MSLSFLKSFGLTETEAKIYEYLIKEGENIPQIIALEAKLKRPTVYKALYSLEKDGLVIQKEIGKKIHFHAASPSKLIELAKEKENQIKQSLTSLNAVLPSLSSSYLLSTEKPVVRVYEGLEGIKQVYLDILKDEKSGFSIMQIENQDPEFATWINNYFNPKRARKKIPLKTIISSGAWASKFKEKDKEFFRFSRIVPKDTFQFEHEVTTYGDKVAFIHYQTTSPLLGVIINHKQFAKTIQALFNLAWMSAENY
jgi:sugar-specific transcriptional regulator TrmB